MLIFTNVTKKKIKYQTTEEILKLQTTETSRIMLRGQSLFLVLSMVQSLPNFPYQNGKSRQIVIPLMTKRMKVMQTKLLA